MVIFGGVQGNSCALVFSSAAKGNERIILPTSELKQLEEVIRHMRLQYAIQIAAGLKVEASPAVS